MKHPFWGTPIWGTSRNWVFKVTHHVQQPSLPGIARSIGGTVTCETFLRRLKSRFWKWRIPTFFPSRGEKVTNMLGILLWDQTFGRVISDTWVTSLKLCMSKLVWSVPELWMLWVLVVDGLEGKTMIPWTRSFCRLNCRWLPSGKLLHNYGKSPILMGKSTISMATFNSKLLVYQTVTIDLFIVDLVEPKPSKKPPDHPAAPVPCSLKSNLFIRTRWMCFNPWGFRAKFRRAKPQQVGVDTLYKVVPHS